jgi:glutamate--cysteine ligase
MGRLGYQSDAQATLAVSYNGLTGYANSLHEALTQPYPAYEAVGMRNPGGDYNQLGTSLLQIENEFYGTIRPKRTVQPGERPLHALRERGVEYVEVRLMDLDPFVPVGITAPTMRLLDVFLLHCLLSDSPPDTPQEITELKRNQHLTAERGREPGLCLVRNGQNVALVDWAAQVLQECAPLAAALDASHHSTDYSAALASARATLANPVQTPSARVLEQMARPRRSGGLRSRGHHSWAAGPASGHSQTTPRPHGGAAVRAPWCTAASSGQSRACRRQYPGRGAWPRSGCRPPPAGVRSRFCRWPG